MAGHLSEICLSCGMCCDGTLFGKAKIKDEADKKRVEAFDLIVSDTQFFDLPCHHFKGKCSIYEQQRPNICGAYLCKPLKQLKAGEINRQAAQVIIDKALSLKALFEEEQKHFPEFAAQSVFYIRQVLFAPKQGQALFKTYRLKYAKLYLLGAKLFPLLSKIAEK